MNRTIAWLAAMFAVTSPHHSDDLAASAKKDRAAGFCRKLVSDTAAKPLAALPMPGYLQSVVDPVFGTTITRVTGAPGDTIPNVGGRAGTWRDIGGPTYAKYPSWNADQSLIVSTTSAPGYLFIGGSNYHVVAFRGSVPGGSGPAEVRWDPADKDLMVYVFEDGRAGYWNPLADTVGQRIGPAPELHACRIGPWEGNVSNDGRRVVLSCLADRANGDSAYVFFAADLASGTRYPVVRAVDLGFRGVNTSSGEPLDWASISPLGDYIVASQDWQLSRALTLDGNVVSSWTQTGHYDLGLDVAGREVAFNGSGYLVTLATGAVTPIARTGGRAYHSSTRNQPGAPGWGFASLEDTLPGPMGGEIVAMELKPDGAIRRLVQHRSTGRSYDHNAFGSPSPDGMRVFYRSDWGDASGPVYGFVVDTRNLCRGERALSY